MGGVLESYIPIPFIFSSKENKPFNYKNSFFSKKQFRCCVLLNNASKIKTIKENNFSGLGVGGNSAALRRFFWRAKQGVLLIVVQFDHILFTLFVKIEVWNICEQDYLCSHLFVHIIVHDWKPYYNYNIIGSRT